MVHPEPRSQSGRLAPLPFSLAVLGVYALSFGSQLLLSPAATGSIGVFGFALVQAILIAAWIVLHMRRLRDAGRPAGLAIGIAVVYAIEVILLLIIVGLIVANAAGNHQGVGSDASILQLFLIVYFFSLLAGDASLGALQAWMTGFAVVMLLPVVIAVGFSIWAATRPTLSNAP